MKFVVVMSCTEQQRLCFKLLISAQHFRCMLAVKVKNANKRLISGVTNNVGKLKAENQSEETPRGARAPSAQTAGAASLHDADTSDGNAVTALTPTKSFPFTVADHTDGPRHLSSCCSPSNNRDKWGRVRDTGRGRGTAKSAETQQSGETC